MPGYVFNGGLKRLSVMRTRAANQRAIYVKKNNRGGHYTGTFPSPSYYSGR